MEVIIKINEKFKFLYIPGLQMSKYFYYLNNFIPDIERAKL